MYAHQVLRLTSATSDRSIKPFQDQRYSKEPRELSPPDHKNLKTLLNNNSMKWIATWEWDTLLLLY